MKENEETVLSCWKKIGVFGDSTCSELERLIHCRNCFQYNNAGRSLFDREVPGEFLDEWTRNMTSAKEQETRNAVSLIVFRIAGEWLALRTVYLQETANLRPVHHVPFRTNRVFKGLVNINGELLLCFSVGDLTESSETGEPEQSESAAGRRMLVINGHGERYVFPVEEILGVYRIPMDHLQKPPATLTKSPSGVVETVFTLNQRQIGLLGEDKLIHALKRSMGH